MSEEATEQAQAEVSSTPEVEAFDIFDSAEAQPAPEGEAVESAEPAQAEPAAEEQTQKKSKDSSWSERVKKDRAQRRKEIELKRKAIELSKREELVVGKAKSTSEMRELLISNPEEYFRQMGINPHQFYEEWTTRMATGGETGTSKLEQENLKKEINDLKREMAERDKRDVDSKKAAEQERLIEDFHGKIDKFKASNDKYPLTSAQCSAQDIAEGMSQYWRKTGVELTFDEAFEMIEEGLRGEEEQLLQNPRLQARFKKQFGIEDAGKTSQAKEASKTLSNKMAVAPTKQAPEDMTHEEIVAHWSGKIYT